MIKYLMALLVLVLMGCAPMLWNKPGASQSDFSTDKYDCLQQSQQRVSGAVVNSAGGFANNQVITNGGLFASCLNSKGWYLASNQPTRPSLQPQSNPLKDVNVASVVAFKAACASEDVKAYINKSPCNSNEITLEQMSDKSRISADEKIALSKYRAANQSVLRTWLSGIRQYGGANGAELARAREKTQMLVEKNQLDLYEGTIAWGEYNKVRNELGIQYQQEFNQIIHKR